MSFYNNIENYETSNYKPTANPTAKPTVINKMNKCNDIPGYILMNNKFNTQTNIDNKYDTINEAVINCDTKSFDECNAISYNKINNNPFTTSYYIINKKSKKVENSNNNECFYSRREYNNIKNDFF